MPRFSRPALIIPKIFQRVLPACFVTDLDWAVFQFDLFIFQQPKHYTQYKYLHEFEVKLFVLKVHGISDPAVKDDSPIHVSWTIILIFLHHLRLNIWKPAILDVRFK